MIRMTHYVFSSFFSRLHDFLRFYVLKNTWRNIQLADNTEENTMRQENKTVQANSGIFVASHLKALIR